MKNKLILSILLFNLNFFLLAIANPIQKITLKNGSVLDGYISMQHPGKDFAFTTEKAIIYLPSKEVLSIADQEVNIKKLSKEWIEWAEKNDAFTGVGDNRTFTLSDIITSKGTTANVRVLERGAKVKYLEISPKTYSLTWDTIQVVNANKRSKLALSGIDRSYKLSSGVEYEGQYVEEIPGKTLSLYCKNGVVEVFETNKVAKYQIIPINSNQSLFEQSELVDNIVLKNGSILNGIIIEQNYSNTDSKSGYLLIKSENNSIQSVKHDDIAEYRKIPNPSYKPLYDILLKKGEIVINRNETKQVPTIEENSHIILKTDSCSTIINKDSINNNIVVEAFLEDEILAKQLNIVKVNTYKDHKIKTFGFTYEDIVKNSIQPISITTSSNKTTKIVFHIKEPGFYAIYNPKNKSSVPFMIK